MDRQEHWDTIHTTKQTTQVSWFAPHLDTSLRMIDMADLSKHAAIIDVGCGASTLIDDLLERCYSALTCMDITAEAYAPIQERLGERANNVR